MNILMINIQPTSDYPTAVQVRADYNSHPEPAHPTIEVAYEFLDTNGNVVGTDDGAFGGLTVILADTEDKLKEVFALDLGVSQR